MDTIPDCPPSRKIKSLSTGIALALTLLTLVVYWQVQGHDFLVWDDFEYVVENPHVRYGMSLPNVRWAVTSPYASNWHPLTWISHMLDCDLYGLNPAGHHLNNLLLHLINTVLLFSLLVRMTASPWRCAFVAAIFAIHPLHVESVAWVSERKDLLSTLFLFLTCHAYVSYTRRPGASRYALCLALFILGLASKPMIVTLPLILLLLDYWPLSRGSFVQPPQGRMRLASMVLEKWPFFLLSVLSAIVTFLVSRSDQAVAPIEALPLVMRVGNAVLSYALYLGKAFWPLDLAFFYPHPLTGLQAGKVAGAALLLTAVSVLAFRTRRDRPYLMVGWLWFLVTLLPVIGLIQAGSQAMADRYAYVPLIGVSVMVAWGLKKGGRRPRRELLRDLRNAEGGRKSEERQEVEEESDFVPSVCLVVKDQQSSRWLRAAFALCSGAVILLLALVARSEIAFWKNGETLFQRAIAVTSGNYTAHYMLGIERMRQGRVEEAVSHYEAALRFRPDHLPARRNLAIALTSQGRTEEALLHLLAAAKQQPQDAGIHASIGDVYLMQGKMEQAISAYSEALRLDPLLGKVHNNLGSAFLRIGKTDEAIRHFEETLKIYPLDRKAGQNLDIARKKLKETL